MSRGDRFPAAPLKPEVAAQIQRWTPKPKTVPLGPQDRKWLEPMTRELIAAVGPGSPTAARRHLGFLGLFLAWADRRIGSHEPDTISPRNVSGFIAELSQDRSLSWQNGARVALQQVGRVVNPAAWPAKTQQLQHPVFSTPYSAEDEALILMASRLPGAQNPAARLWSAAAPLGAGLRTYEAAITEAGDVCELGDGRLGVRVRGRLPRLVPVRAMWTDPMREALSLVQARPRGSSSQFVIRGKPGMGGSLARRLPWGREEGVSHPRMRVTWLAAHLRAGTSIDALRVLAGSLGADLLHHLLAEVDLRLTPEEAVAEGLRA